MTLYINVAGPRGVRTIDAVENESDAERLIGEYRLAFWGAHGELRVFSSTGLWVDWNVPA